MGGDRGPNIPVLGFNLHLFKKNYIKGQIPISYTFFNIFFNVFDIAPVFINNQKKRSILWNWAELLFYRLVTLFIAESQLRLFSSYFHSCSFLTISVSAYFHHTAFNSSFLLRIATFYTLSPKYCTNMVVRKVNQN